MDFPFRQLFQSVMGVTFGSGKNLKKFLKFPPPKVSQNFFETKSSLRNPPLHFSDGE